MKRKNEKKKEKKVLQTKETKREKRISPPILPFLLHAFILKHGKQKRGKERVQVLCIYIIYFILFRFFVTTF